MLEGVPDRLGPYSLAERLGEGAQAAVFLAQDPEGRAVAVKVRRAGDPEEDRRFLREFESMRLLRVPGVVAVHSAGVDGDLLWFSMDRVHGRPFSEAVLEEPYIPERVDRTIDLATSLLDTLAGLHAAGFAHRDIKPSNVLVDPGGGVHVLDFGIGQDFRSSERLGAADFVLGTVAYMAPEQLANLPTDERADLFAVGLMLHEAIAGPREVPRHVLGWIPRTCVEQLTPLATRFRQVPLAFSHLVERLLSVDPRDRPSARRAAAELRRLRASEDSLEAPEPPFVDPGHWWTTLEGCLGQGDKPIQVLEGPAGSGRRRIAEQLHRLGLLDQIWTLHLHCRVDQVGGPLLELMEVLIASFDAHGIRELVGDRAAAVRAAWPHLAVAATHPDRDDAPLRATDVVDAVVHTIAKLAATRNLLLVIHDTEQVDPLTARVLAALAEHAGPALGLLLIVDPRWHRRLSRNLVKRLDRMECVSRVQAQPPTAEAVQAIARSLSPESEAPFDVEAGVSPQLAVEAGLSALAQWRGFRWPEPNAAVWPLAVHDAPLPVTVYRALVGRRGESTPLVEVRARGVCLTSAGARRMARVRLASLAHSATLIATAWEET
ncbi:MAG: tRNA A-37 threonylcarbamoyl transferase component Bud32, partial [Myxococcota bacterium]